MTIKDVFYCILNPDEKTVSLGSLPNNTSKTYSSGLTNETVINIFGLALSGNVTLPLPYVYDDTSRVSLDYDGSAHTINIRTFINRSAYTGYATLQYIKS